MKRVERLQMLLPINKFFLQEGFKPTYLLADTKSPKKEKDKKLKSYKSK